MMQGHGTGSVKLFPIKLRGFNATVSVSLRRDFFTISGEQVIGVVLVCREVV